MNWLAHIFLSENSIDFQIGNYLADPLKAKAWSDASNDLKKGIQTHILIDSFTDSHFFVKKSINTIREKGLLRPIVIDITYDYLLTKNWDKFCNVSFEKYVHDFYDEASKRLEYLPIHAADKLSRIIKYQVLHKYQKVDDLKDVFERMDKNRLSEKLLKRDSASSYFESIKNNIDSLEEDFLIFFPLLCEEVRENVDINKINHWKI